ncbi:MAG: hypothetical protein HZB46_16600, partial [Solirubrobacterales bacterium]|nr:hypothetical protein [Solirubrobacterales bacterium]
MRPLLAVVALLLVVPAAARADWSAPQTVGDLADAVTNPSIAFDGEGRALVTARYSEEDGVPSEGLTRMYTGRPGNVFRSFGIRMNLPVAPVVYGRRATAFLRRNAGSAPRILGTSFGSTTTSAGGFRALTSRASSDPFARRGDAYARTEDLDVNGAGLGVLAWVEPRGGGDLLRVALRRPGGAFHALQDLRGTGRVSAVTVAVGEGGDAVVAWQRVNGRERTIEARVRRGSQERFGHLQVIGESRGIAQVAADVAPTSRAVVAWGTQD